MAQVRIAKQRTVLEFYDVSGHRLKVKGGIEGVLQQNVYRDCPKCNAKTPEPECDWPGYHDGSYASPGYRYCPRCGAALPKREA